MRSYIKLYGPLIMEAIRALQKIAIDVPEVCIMDNILADSMPLDNPQALHSYFSTLAPVTVERCSNIISKSGAALGEYDFYFEWFVEPSDMQLYELIVKIDEALTKVGCRYTITTKKDKTPANSLISRAKASL